MCTQHAEVKILYSLVPSELVRASQAGQLDWEARDSASQTLPLRVFSCPQAAR
jgi:hypothetical protein